jgi:hypothetical protein
MIGVSVTSNVKEVSANFALSTVKLEKATVRALNRAVDQSATAANRGIRERYNVKAQVVANALKKLYASGHSIVLFSEIKVRGSRIPLAEFVPREKTVTVKATRFGHTRKAVSVKVLRAGARKTVKGGFLTGRGIFKRVGKERYPIKFLRSVSIPQAFLQKTIIKDVQKIARDSFERNLLQQVRFLGSR